MDKHYNNSINKKCVTWNHLGDHAVQAHWGHRARLPIAFDQMEWQVKILNLQRNNNNNNNYNNTHLYNSMFNRGLNAPPRFLFRSSAPSIKCSQQTKMVRHAGPRAWNLLFGYIKTWIRAGKRLTNTNYLARCRRHINAACGYNHLQEKTVAPHSISPNM